MTVCLQVPEVLHGVEGCYGKVQSRWSAFVCECCIGTMSTHGVEAINVLLAVMHWHVQNLRFSDDHAPPQECQACCCFCLQNRSANMMHRGCRKLERELPYLQKTPVQAVMNSIE